LAFIDEGVLEKAGLEHYLIKSKAKIFMLDSVGSDAPLHVSGHDFLKTKEQNYRLNPLSTKYSTISLVHKNVRKRKQKTSFIWDKSDLKQKKLNMQNFNEKVVRIFK